MAGAPADLGRLDEPACSRRGPSRRTGRARRRPGAAASASSRYLRGTATACILASGRAVDLDDLLQAFLDELAARYATLPAVPGEYRARLATIGRRVRVEKASATGDGDALEGLAVDVDDDGRLVVRDDHGTDASLA